MNNDDSENLVAVSTSEHFKPRGFLARIKHHATVQRGIGLKPLRYKSGAYIYNENDRHLSGNESSSPKPQETNNALFGLFVFIFLLFVSVAMWGLFGPKVGVVAVALTMLIVSPWLGLFALLGGILIIL